MYFRSTKCLTLIICSLLSVSLSAKEAKISDFAQGLKKPMCFVENKGQVMDMDNHPRNDIQYKLSTPGMSLFLGNGQLQYQFKSIEGKDANAQLTTYRMDVTLAGANPNAKVVAADEQEYYENYFLAQLGGEGVTAHSWNKVIYKDVYPNIDWVLYIKDNKVEYDFNVKPGGKVSDIKIVYGGASNLKITNEGNLSAETPMGTIIERKPVSFETGTHKSVASKFVLHNNVVCFETGNYKDGITIDPYVLWSTYIGNTLEDVVTSVKVSITGVVFAGGYSTSAGIGTGGVYQPAHAAGVNYDAFIAKYNAIGTLAYCTYWGGTGSDQGLAIAIDPNSATPNVYLAGTTNSVGMGSPGAYRFGFGGGTSDGFIFKLTNAGNARIFATYYGGSGADQLNAIAVDGTGNIYVAGQTGSATLVASAGAYQTALSGSVDACIGKFTNVGANTWNTYYGGSAQDQAYGIALDAAGNIYVGGQTNSIVNMASAGAYQTTLSGTNDAFIAKFTNGGTRTWGTYFGGTGTEQVNGIACDPLTGNIAFAGNTSSTTNISTTKAYQKIYGGGVQDAFLAYFNNTGGQLWTTYLGGPSLDYGESVCFDGSGNAIMAGGTFSSTGIASQVGTFSPGGFQPAIGGDYDAFVSKFNIIGQSVWSTYFGGTLYDYANSVVMDLANDQVTLGGYTTSNGAYGTGGISQGGVTQPANGGGTYDGFVTKFLKDTIANIAQPFADSFVCAGGQLTVRYNVKSNFKVGNVFTIQLSDLSGSFTTPVNIGSSVTNLAGTVTCTIPAATVPGTGYRIRLVSTNPVYISPDDFFDITVLSSLPHTIPIGTTPTCVGATIQLRDSSGYAVTSYLWLGPAGSGFGGAGFTSTLQIANNNGFSGTGATLADSGTYSIVTTHNGCPNDTATIDIVVNNTIPPSPWDSSSSVNCAGDTIYLFSRNDTAATVSFLWSGPGGYTSTKQNPKIAPVTAANSGVYTVREILAGCASAAGSITIAVTPTSPNSVSITVSPNDTICSGTMVTFTAIPVNGGATPNYQWMSGTSTPIVGAISSIFSSPTLIDLETIFVDMTSSATCPSPVHARSNIVTMNVINTSPIVHIYSSPSTYVVPGHSVSFTSAVYNGGTSPKYQWKKNGVKIPGATNTSYVLPNVTANCNITLVVTTTMLCAIPDSATSNDVLIIPTLGVGQVNTQLDNVELFPNPNTGSFTIKGNLDGLNGSELSYEIINPLGQLVYSEQGSVQNNELNKNIDLNNLSDGIYLLRINQTGASKTIRFTVRH